MILPRIKEIKYNNKYFNNNLVFPKSFDGENAAKLLNLFLPNAKVLCDYDFNVVLNKLKFDKKGEYKLFIKESQIVIDYCDYQGLRNAIATLSGSYENGKLKCVEIYDYPTNDFRSCLLDLARGYVEIGELKEHLLRLAKLKFNYVHLHLMDRQSYILKSNVVPNPDNHKQYTKEELKDIVDFCKLLSLQVIPEIEFPAHAVNLLKALPQLSCDIIDIDKARKDVMDAPNPRKEFYIDKQKEVSSWVVCVGKESTYKIYEDIIDEIVEIFDSEYIHIGGDEIEFKKLAAFPHWDNCYECKKLFEKYNGDILSLYHHGIRRINEIVKSKGKKTIKWNESTECVHNVDLPTDIILEYWLSDDASSSQSHIDRFIEMGYKIINAQHQYTYVDLHEYLNAEKISDWAPFKNESQKSAIMGGEMCAWELGNKDYSYYDYTLPICTVLFSDRVWNSDVTEYNNDYVKSIFDAVVGNSLLKDNPLKFFKEIIPPRKLDVLECLDIQSVSLDELSQTILELKNVNSCYGKIALEKFIKYLEKLYREISTKRGLEYE